MDHSDHTEAIVAALQQRMRSPYAAQIRTNFGVVLTAVPGRFVVGQRVWAQGLDECSARLPADVLAVGLRWDHPGIWYWLRHRDVQQGESLMQEEALTAFDGRPSRDDGALLHGTRPSVPPQHAKLASFRSGSPRPVGSPA